MDQMKISPKKSRKQRQCLSCTECRRLKLKCDRATPCSTCIRRRCSSSCRPAGSVGQGVRSGSNSNVSQQSLDSSIDTVPIYHYSPGDNQARRDPNLATTKRRTGQGVRRPLHQQTMNLLEYGNPQALDACEEQSADVQRFHEDGTTQATSEHNFDMVDFQPSHGAKSSHFVSRMVESDDQNISYGTLTLNTDGRSQYLGPTAGSEWLKDSDASRTPSDTCDPSLETPSRSKPLSSDPATEVVAFPFYGTAAHVGVQELLSHLPTRDEALVLVKAYYRYCAWHHDIAPEHRFRTVFDRVFAAATKVPTTVNEPHEIVLAQEIALVFVILAQGIRYNIELPFQDAEADEWLRLSELALMKGNFLTDTVVAGLQTLHLMAHIHLESDRGHRGGAAWPLWGLTMRLLQAMGMHRDGARWNLADDVVEERRKVFWECNAADVFQAHCFSRPAALDPEHCDTIYPYEPVDPNGETGYFTLRFELSQISTEILALSLKVRKPPYETITEMDSKLRTFEDSMPFFVRCRAAALSTSSRYPTAQAAIIATPEPARVPMPIVLQRANLALNLSETFINLHRPYYAKALYEVNDDPITSDFAPSFLAILERCSVILAVVADIHTRFPAVSVRQWNFWFHVYNSALCLGTFVLRAPSSSMAAFAINQIEVAIRLYTSLTHSTAHVRRYQKNLDWLKKLHERALKKIATRSSVPITLQQTTTVDDTRESTLLGWRTRLIQRAGSGSDSVSTSHILIAPNHATDSGSVASNRSQIQVDSDSAVSITEDNSSLEGRFCFGPSDSLDAALNNYWDPVLLQEIFGEGSSLRIVN